MAIFNYEEEVEKRMRKLERLHQAFEAQDLDSGGLQDLKKEAFKCCMWAHNSQSEFKRHLMTSFGETSILYFGTDPQKIDAVSHSISVY